MLCTCMVLYIYNIYDVAFGRIYYVFISGLITHFSFNETCVNILTENVLVGLKNCFSALQQYLFISPFVYFHDHEHVLLYSVNDVFQVTSKFLHKVGQ